MPPEMLARMVRNQRARQKSNGSKGSGSDEDSDEAEPAAKPPLGPRPTRPSPNTQPLSPGTPSWGALMQLTSDLSTPVPPPFPPPASPHASAPRTALRAQPALRPPPAFARPASRSGVKDLVEKIDAPKSAYLAAPIEGNSAASDWLSHAGVVLISLLLGLAAFGVYLAISLS